MIRDLVLDAQTTEPAVRQVDLNLPAEQRLRTDGKNVADDEHPDHQHRVNRRAAARRVVGCKLKASDTHIATLVERHSRLRCSSSFQGRTRRPWWSRSLSTSANCPSSYDAP